VLGGQYVAVVREGFEPQAIGEKRSEFLGVT
jgi:hypothetical protein